MKNYWLNKFEENLPVEEHWSVCLIDNINWRLKVEIIGGKIWKFADKIANLPIIQ